MKTPITKKEARAFKARWRAVNRAELEELRGKTAGQKLTQLAALMSAMRHWGWVKDRAEDEQRVRDRWRRLREAFDG